MAQIINKLFVYTLQTQIPTEFNPILNLDWRIALTHFMAPQTIYFYNKILIVSTKFGKSSTLPPINDKLKPLSMNVSLNQRNQINRWRFGLKPCFYLYKCKYLSIIIDI